VVSRSPLYGMVAPVDLGDLVTVSEGMEEDL
jgi:hypothetical protein